MLEEKLTARFKSEIPDIFGIADYLNLIGEFAPITLLKSYMFVTGKSFKESRSEATAYLELITE